ncbi:MAG: YabP/YqfC family sporulation protein [Oscillospiraceae bacterium]|nr:YabP/YqfC family sporulation protein [Oscillospiraceae bacterium]
MMHEQIQLPHRLTLNERKQLTMNGVTEVLSFDEQLVVVHTGYGTLSIHGQDLKLKTLSPDGGQLAVEGTVAAMIYEEPRKTRGLLGRFVR